VAALSPLCIAALILIIVADQSVEAAWAASL
jgi:hypothetical protein